MTTEIDKRYMQRAIDLAEKGRGTTRPNPLVGAVVVRDDNVVGEGYHQKAGTDHAEIVAMKAAGDRTRGATLYVTLEPCCHTGRTGPCTDRIIDAGFAGLVLAAIDADPRVSGQGAERLRQAGIDVTGGVLDDQAQLQNDIYFHHCKFNRPFVILKTAQTLDGRIATCSGDSKWITGEESRAVAHRLRAEVDAVIVGGGTVRTDNPSLTVRHTNGENPSRIVVSLSLDLPYGANVLVNDDGKTILASSARSIDRFKQRHANQDHLQFWPLAESDDGLVLSDLIDHAAAAGMRGLLVEGGATLLTSFLRAGLANKYVHFTAPKLVGAGVNGVGDLGIRKIDKAIEFTHGRYDMLGDDMLFTGYLKGGA